MRCHWTYVSEQSVRSDTVARHSAAKRLNPGAGVIEDGLEANTMVGGTSSEATSDDSEQRPADQRILDATLTVLAKKGLAGASMRAVAAEAGLSVGLANYHFENKTALICAALKRVGDQDAQMVASSEGADPTDHLRQCLRRTLDTEILTREYLSLRLQMWSLAGVDPQFAEINRTAQRRYLEGLAQLLQAARTDLRPDEVERRAADILIVQNGVWLTAILITEPKAVLRAIDRCNELAFE